MHKRDMLTQRRPSPRRSAHALAALGLSLALATSACRSNGSGAMKERDWAAFPAVATLSGAQEIYALGDLHGDSTSSALLLARAGLISSTTPFHWTGGDKVLVVLGDVIDKGSSALAVIDMLAAIEPEARAAGGRVIVTLGNHEAEFLADPTDSKSLVFQTELTNRGLDPERVAAGEGPYGKWLLNLPLAALIDGWLFCHGGNTQNRTVDGMTAKFKEVVKEHLTANGKAGFNDAAITGEYSVLQRSAWWNDDPTLAPTAVIDANLSAIGAAHVVVGHEPGELEFKDDPQGKRNKGELVQRYQGRLFLVDVGLSYAVGYSDGALLRIVRGNPDQTSIVFRDGTSRDLWP